MEAKAKAAVAAVVVGGAAVMAVVLATRKPAVLKKRPGDPISLVARLKNFSIMRATGEPAPYTFNFRLSPENLGRLDKVAFLPEETKTIRIEAQIPLEATPGEYSLILEALVDSVVLKEFDAGAIIVQEA